MVSEHLNGVLSSMPKSKFGNTTPLFKCSMSCNLSRQSSSRRNIAKLWPFGHHSMPVFDLALLFGTNLVGSFYYLLFTIKSGMRVRKLYFYNMYGCLEELPTRDGVGQRGCGEEESAKRVGGGGVLTDHARRVRSHQNRLVAGGRRWWGHYW